MQSLASKLKYLSTASVYALQNKSINISAPLATMTSKLKVLVTQPIPKEAVDILSANANLELIINDKTPLKRDFLLHAVKDCDALFCTLNEKIDKELLDASGRKLKVAWVLFLFFLYESYVNQKTSFLSLEYQEMQIILFYLICIYLIAYLGYCNLQCWI